ncbi:electron transfer flavoprotein subunit alpha [Eubacteriaceae bacterium ES3]|nr:electron transfer flavoprotein subunit alpha [Eubacteriaceae bacterium ES3]
MNFIHFDVEKCTLCRLCIEKCPFEALSMGKEGIEVNESCRMCNVCVKVCPEGAIFFEQKAGQVDKGQWSGILVFAQQQQGEIHPVTFELIGEAQRLSRKNSYQVNVVLVGGQKTAECAEVFRYYGVDKVFVYEHEALTDFRADNYTNAIADCITRMHPSVVLIGATALGRSLAPRLSTRFHTGLTADCTKLEMKENTDLVQIRPAFGGNVMAQILTTDSRPQFATVRYKVMDAPEVAEEAAGEIIISQVTEEIITSGITIKEVSAIEKSHNIEDEEILVVAGRGVKDEKGIKMVEQLAEVLGGQLCFTRPMVEEGHGDPTHQIGLSGRTVKPKLIITCGVSGAIQFTASMNQADHIVAIDSNPDAQIFNLAHYCINDDLYEVIPPLITRLKEQKEEKANVFSLS